MNLNPTESEAFKTLKSFCPDVERFSFAAALRFFDRLSLDGDISKDGFGMIPDACRIEVRKQNHTFGEFDVVLQIFEIENTCAVSQEKMDKYIRFGMELFDSCDCLLEVFVTDRFGRNPTLIYESSKDNFH